MISLKGILNRGARRTTPAATGPDVSLPQGKEPGLVEATEQYYIASERELIWRKFRKHRVAMVSGSAWKARNARECPSMSANSSPAFVVIIPPPCRRV